MNILIGNDNNLNSKLIEEIKILTPIERMTLTDLEQKNIEQVPDGYLFINLLDTIIQSSVILRQLKEKFPKHTIIAMHCFQVDHMIESLIQEGFDAYISVLNFEEGIHDVITSA
ncbi:hypothetical protein [Flammeovirga kamogawensis]|uniref:DNA-binding response regulator n=1 Tax=Flammeovirga kamogawensis TaxID=373891 RepID=A0ABX8GS82_9BACT|nr:hypothetical protein [Flammeovirga kamogawensis]MBB6461479.1 hypothetical protein [Flammeovirga kamogawensis]QWG06371.1 hypothetical protein KM029_13655 [Flammeovirga kamogawensis]TRX68200.1 hypothetical protein EO216_08670 [Flammeovirga kamogawensis]